MVLTRQTLQHHARRNLVVGRTVRRSLWSLHRRYAVILHLGQRTSRWKSGAFPGQDPPRTKHSELSRGKVPRQDFCAAQVRSSTTVSNLQISWRHFLFNRSTIAFPPRARHKASPRAQCPCTSISIPSLPIHLTMALTSRGASRALRACNVRLSGMGCLNQTPLIASDIDRPAAPRRSLYVCDLLDALYSRAFL